MTDDEDETVTFSDTRAADLFMAAGIGIGLGVGAMTWPWWD